MFSSIEDMEFQYNASCYYNNNTDPEINCLIDIKTNASCFAIEQFANNIDEINDLSIMNYCQL